MSKYSMQFTNRCSDAEKWRMVEAAQNALWIKAATYRRRAGKHFTIETFERVEDSPNFEAVKRADGAVWARFSGGVTDRNASEVSDAFLEAIFAIKLPEVEGAGRKAEGGGRRTENGGRRTEDGKTDQGTTGLRDDGTTGRRDHGTTGPRDDGTTGQRDYGTTGQTGKNAASQTVEAAPVQAKAETAPAPVKAVSVAIWGVNEKKRGVEIRFPGKPSDTVLESLRNFGFRWSDRLKVWWCRDGENERKAATIICRMAELAPGEGRRAEDGGRKTEGGGQRTDHGTTGRRDNRTTEKRDSGTGPQRFDPLAVESPAVPVAVNTEVAEPPKEEPKASAAVVNVIHADFVSKPAVFEVPVARLDGLPAWLKAKMAKNRTA